MAWLTPRKKSKFKLTHYLYLQRLAILARHNYTYS
jgi:hypothetical protein